MTLIIVGVVVLVILAIVFFATYTVIGSNEAHVIVFMGRGRSIKSPVGMNGTEGKTSYFYIPFLMKRYIMPLTNVKLDIEDIHLNDLELAPFICDVVTWLHIADPVRAAERLSFDNGNVFASLHADLQAIVQAIARAASMKQEILEIMRDRAKFSEGVSTEVDIVLKEWGVELVNLEVNDIRDEESSAIISNYEDIRKAGIQSKARIEVAARNREAVEAEATNKQKAEIAVADSEKAFKTKQIERDTTLGIATQDQQLQIAVAEQKTNEQKVTASRVITVGEANIIKEATVVRAQGEADAIKVKGEREADVITLKGKADGSAIESKGLAEAKSKDAMAEALKKFNDAATTIEKIKAVVEVQKSFAEAYASIAANADIKIVTSGDGGNILGLPMNAKTGADFGAMLAAFGSEKISEAINKITK